MVVRQLAGPRRVALEDYPERTVATASPPLSAGRPRGHGKSEFGTAAGRAAHGDVAAERLDQALDDVQAETGAAAALAPPELAEHPVHHLRGDPLPLVAHRDGDRLVAADPRALYHDRYDTSPVPDGVFHEVAENLVDLVGVQPGVRQVAGDLEAVPVLRLAGRHPARDEPASPLGDVDQLAVHFHPARLD